MRLLTCGLLVGALAAPTGLAAQQPQPVVAIRAGTLIDGTGAAPVRNVVILIQGERVTAVGPNVQVPAGATVIDLSAHTDRKSVV